MSEPKVIVAGWYTVDPGRRDQLVERCKDMVLRARNAPGCLDLAITADPVDAGRVNIFELWRSEQDLDAWRAVARAPRPMAPLLRTEVQKHLIQQSGPPFGMRRPKRRPSAR